MTGLEQAGAAAAALLAILGLVSLVVRQVRRAWRPVADFLEDWRGEEPRAGVPGRPGVMARLDRIERRMAAVEGQVHPNGGASMHDKVTAIKEVVVDQP